jgi:hypothetical protein
MMDGKTANGCHERAAQATGNVRLGFTFESQKNVESKTEGCGGKVRESNPKGCW